MNTDVIRKQHLWVSIEKNEVDIQIKSSKYSSFVLIDPIFNDAALGMLQPIRLKVLGSFSCWEEQFLQ